MPPSHTLALVYYSLLFQKQNRISIGLPWTGVHYTESRPNGLPGAICNMHGPVYTLPSLQRSVDMHQLLQQSNTAACTCLQASSLPVCTKANSLPGRPAPPACASVIPHCVTFMCTLLPPLTFINSLLSNSKLAKFSAGTGFSHAVCSSGTPYDERNLWQESHTSALRSVKSHHAYLAGLWQQSRRDGVLPGAAEQGDMQRCHHDDSASHAGLQHGQPTARACDARCGISHARQGAAAGQLLHGGGVARLHGGPVAQS